MTLCGKPEKAAAIISIFLSSISPRIDPKDTSMTPSSPDLLTNSFRSSGSGLAGLDKRGPTNLVSGKHERRQTAYMLENTVKSKSGHNVFEAT